MQLTAALREFHPAQQFYFGGIAMHPPRQGPTLSTHWSQYPALRDHEYYQLMTQDQF